MQKRELTGLHAPKWKFSYYSEVFTWIPRIHIRKELLWKDKFGTPRVEMEPWIEVWVLWWSLNWRKNDDECEWWLWLHIYNKGNLRKALSSWPWKEIKPEEENELFGIKGK